MPTPNQQILTNIDIRIRATKNGETRMALPVIDQAKAKEILATLGIVAIGHPPGFLKTGMAIEFDSRERMIEVFRAFREALGLRSSALDPQ